MKKNPTMPVVITDANGKITTVHRKAVDHGAARTKLPAVTLNAMSDNAPAPDREDLYSDLSAIAEATYSPRLVFQAKSAFFRNDVEMLSILARFPGEDKNDPNYVAQAIKLLRENGDDPDSVLTQDTLGALCRMRRELTLWQMKYDNDKGSDVDHGVANQEALMLMLIEKPEREALMIHCLKDREVGDATDIMNLEPEFNKVHRVLTDGLL
jgi:hypothetical protein